MLKGEYQNNFIADYSVLIIKLYAVCLCILVFYKMLIARGVNTWANNRSPFK